MSRPDLTAAMAGAQPVRLAPWLSRPEDSIPIEQTSERAVLVPGLDIGTGEPGTAVLASYSTPDRYMARIELLGFGGPDTSATAQVTFSIKIGSHLLQGYQFIPAVIGTILSPAPVHIILDPNVTMSIVATNASVGDARMVTRLAGWMFDPKAGGR